MLQRFASRSGGLRQIPRARAAHPRNQNRSNSKSPLTKAGGCTTHLARGTATPSNWICRRPRAMMSSRSNSAGVSGTGTKTETYLDYTSSPDVDFDHIKSTMTCRKFHDSVWGFVIYRCSEGNQNQNQNQVAWDRLLEALRAKVQEDLLFYMREDMLGFHNLHVIDDKALYGATSHQVRDHFRSWVPKNLEDRLGQDATNMDDDVDWVAATSTPRYEYCLFVDDICLESLDHPGVNSPVVKVLRKDWESPFAPDADGGRNSTTVTVAAPFHDGVTEYEEEDVGWMYMPLHDYLHKYDLLGKGDWDDQYVRPPYIDGTEEESELVGHWRQQESLMDEA